LYEFLLALLSIFCFILQKFVQNVTFRFVKKETMILSLRFSASAIFPSALISLLAVLATSVRAIAQICPANVPHVDGVWTTLPYEMPLNPISTTLLSNGHVLIVSGDENSSTNYISAGAESYRAAVWAPRGVDSSSVVFQDLSYDVFCSGTAVLPDGRPLIVGGTAAFPNSAHDFYGDNRASIFNPLTRQYPETESMVDGRWYATATALGDGRISAFSGYKVDGLLSETIEIYSLTNAGVGWSSPISLPFVPPLFPRTELLPNGQLFFTGQGSVGKTANSWLFDPVNQSWTVSAPTTANRAYGSAVILPLLPPDYRPRVMNFGGGYPATSSTELIDLSSASPTWTPGPNMSTGRIEMNAVILPNGKVLTEGGSVVNEMPDDAGKHADIYDPVGNTFSSGGTAAYSRLYHSTALLLPNATVMSLGSNPPPHGGYQPAIEIYQPAYLFGTNDRPISRPAITSSAPGVLGYSASFSVNYKSSRGVGSAVLIRAGSATHATDMEQRLVGLCGPAPQSACGPGGGTLTLTTPPNGNIAPPGFYMLFLLDTTGVPSMAQFIQLSLEPGTPPSASISSPAGNVNIVAGSSVNFGTTSSASQYSWVFPGGTPGTSTVQNPGNVIFSTPGTYLASLTEIDSLGNTDPNPPTRKITVLSGSPDFSITVSRFAQVFPGQSGAFTATIAPLGGFKSPVTLNVESQNGFPSGVSSGGFSPPTITGKGSSTLTMNTTTATLPYALSLTVTATSGSVSHTGSTTLIVSLAPPANLGAQATSQGISLQWTPSAGASGYHVKRSNSAGGPYVGIGCTTSASFNDDNVVSGGTYHYVVDADYSGGPDAGGESADSSEVIAAAQ
jgi:hypothetical protein